MPAVPRSQIDYQRCSGLSLTLNHLTTESVERMVRCLNSTGDLQELEMFLEKAPREDVTEAIRLWNDVIGDHPVRFEQTLTLFDRLSNEKIGDRSHLDELAAQLAGFIESGFAQASLQALRIIDQRSRTEMGESFLKSLVGAYRNLQGKSPTVQKTRFQTLARLTDNNIAQWMATRVLSGVQLIGQSGGSGSFPQLSATQATQLSLLVAYDWYARGDLPKIWSRIAMPSTLQIFPTDTKQALGIEGVFALLTDSGDQFKRLQSLQSLVKDFDRPLKCFLAPPANGGSGRALQIRNVFDLVLREKALRRGDPLELASFLLKDLNLLVGIAKEQCEIDETTKQALSTGAEYFQDMTLAGHSQGHAHLLNLFLEAGRTQDLKNIIRSPDLLELAPLISFLSQRGILAPMMVELRRHLSEGEYLVLVEFIEASARALPKVNWLFQLGAESSGEFTEELTRFFESGFSYIRRSDVGIGSLFSALARAEAVTVEAPFYEGLGDVLSRPDLLDRFLKLYPGLISGPEFEPALGRVGKMAASGDLKRIIGFLVELHRATGRNRVSGENLGWSHQPAASLPIEMQDESLGAYAPTWLSAASKCEKARDGLSSGEGVASALQCLSSDGPLKTFGRLGEVLREKGLLSEASNLVKDGLFKKSLVPGSIGALKFLEKSGFFGNLNTLNLRSKKVSSADFLKDLEFFLATPQAKAPEVHGVLSCLGKSVGEAKELSLLVDWAGTFLDQREQRAVSFKSDYVIPIYDQGSLRQQMDSFPELSSLPPAEKERQFQRAIKEFRERSPDYFYRQKAYKKYSQEDLKTELENYVKAFLNHTNLSELLIALGALSGAREPGAESSLKGLDLGWAIDQLIGVQRVIPYYPGPNEPPQVRVVTPFDQLELLVINVDVEMAQWVPVVGQDNMGMFYMWNVAESTNLPLTLRVMQQAMHAGYLYTKVQEKHKHFMLENDRINFYVLQQMADDGSLRLFQRIYQALYRSTPEPYRRRQDRFKNQIYIAHWPMKYTFFGRLVPLLSELRDRGQLKQLVEGLFALGQMFQASDAPALQALIQSAATQKFQGKTILRHVLDRIFTASENPERGIGVLSRGFQLLTVGKRLGLQPRGLLTSLHQLVQSPALAVKLLDVLFDDLGSKDFSYLGHLSAGVHSGPTDRMSAIKNLGGQWLQSSGGLCVDVLTKLLLNFRSADTLRADQLVGALVKSFTGISSEDRSALKRLLSALSATQKAEPGLNIQVASLLQDAGLRGALVKILHIASTEGLLASLIHELFLPSGENGMNGTSQIQQLIQFIDRTFEDSIPSPHGAEVPVLRSSP